MSNSSNGIPYIRPNNAGDIEILKFIGLFSLSTIRDLCSLTGRSYPAIAARTSKLKKNGLIKVTRSQLENSRMYTWSCEALQLTPYGVAKLADIGFEAKLPQPSIHFIHQLTQSQTSASFEA